MRPWLRRSELWAVASDSLAVLAAVAGGWRIGPEEGLGVPELEPGPQPAVDCLAAAHILALGMLALSQLPFLGSRTPTPELEEAAELGPSFVEDSHTEEDNRKGAELEVAPEQGDGHSTEAEPASQQGSQ